MNRHMMNLTIILVFILEVSAGCKEAKDTKDDTSLATDTIAATPDAGIDAGPISDTESTTDSIAASGAPAIKIPWLAGVSLAGGDFGENNLPGEYNVNYVYPEASSVEYFMDKGMNVFRIPFRWERLQRGLSEPFDDVEVQRFTALIFAITAKGAFAVLDPHNYARYNEQLVGVDIPSSHLADFWTRLATLFMNDEKVIFGLMNEPHDMETETWLQAANEAITAIRAVGAANLILVPGNGWTGAHSWHMDYYGTPNAEVMLGVHDPADNLAFEVHQYLDDDSSGRGSTCESETIGKERLIGFTEWARTNGYRAFLGELGSADNETCMTAIDDMLTYMESSNDVWIGWAWWAAGPWWGNYFMSIEPSDGQDKPQMATLVPHL